MREIWGSEIIAVVFLALPLARPFVKVLRGVGGLVWLPLPALGILAGIFPAYGFRPECIPLLFFALVFNVANIPMLVAFCSRRAGDSAGEGSGNGGVVRAISLALLAAAALVMFVFSPRVDGGLSVDGIRMAIARDENRGREFCLRFYETADSGFKPVVFLIPPEAGSVAAVDRVCAGLRDRGFTVVTYSRRGFDTPFVNETGGKRYAPLRLLRSSWRAFRYGTVLEKANAQGRMLEAERRSDVEFLLPRVPALLGNGKARPANVPFILAGYGAGGSAARCLMGDSAFALRNRNVKGVVAVNSRFWSVYRCDSPVFPQPPVNANWLGRFLNSVANRFRALAVRRVTGWDEIPRCGIPSLYLVSSRAFAPAKKGGAKNPYRAIFADLRGGQGPAALAALDGSGPLDYGDYPLTYPVYSFLFPGLRTQGLQRRSAADRHVDTVNLIANFAVMALERESAAGIAVPPRQVVGGKVFVESVGLPEF